MVTRIVSRAGHGPGGVWETALARPHPRLRPGVISYRGSGSRSTGRAAGWRRRSARRPCCWASNSPCASHAWAVPPSPSGRCSRDRPPPRPSANTTDGWRASRCCSPPGPRSHSSAHRSTNSPTGPWIPTSSRMDWARGTRARAGVGCGASVNFRRAGRVAGMAGTLRPAGRRPRALALGGTPGWHGGATRLNEDDDKKKKTVSPLSISPNMLALVVGVLGRGAA